MKDLRRILSVVVAVAIALASTCECRAEESWADWLTPTLFETEEDAARKRRSPILLIGDTDGYQLPHSDSVNGSKVPLDYESCTDECTADAPAWYDPSVLAEKSWFNRKATSIAGTYIAGDDNKLGIGDFTVSSSYQLKSLPFLSLTPSYQMSFLSGPQQTDLPETLYRAGLDISWFQPLSEQWILQVAVTPGVAADFDTTDAAMIRIMGRALAFYQASEEWKWAIGVVYLARDDLPVLPVAGLVYTPTPDIKFDLMFPKPRFAYRYEQTSSGENWCYIGGEIGGGTYAIERITGDMDVVTIGDLKFLMGLEFKQGTDPKNLDVMFYEVGVVFNRDVEYESGIGDYNPKSTFVARAGLVF